MRSFGVRLPILTVAALAGIGLSMSCMGFAYSQTVYVMPTVATVAWPTTYVSTSSYVAPTTYSFSSYIPAAYIAEPVTVAPTTYLTTGYTVRRGLLGRLRLVERPVIASYGTTYLPSSYLLPTTYLPSSYVVPTSYVPSSYVVPTTYVRSSYVVPTAYYATSYPRTSYVSTTFKPTVFDYPSVGETSYVSSSSLDCEPVPCDPPRVASAYRDYPRLTQPAEPSIQSDRAPSPSGPSKSIPSTPSDAGTIPSNVYPPAAPAPSPRVDTQGAPKNSAPENRADSPPTPPTPSREQSTAPPIQPAPAGAGSGAPAPALAGKWPSSHEARAPEPHPRVSRSNRILGPPPRTIRSPIAARRYVPLITAGTPSAPNSATSWSDGSSPTPASPALRWPSPWRT